MGIYKTGTWGEQAKKRSKSRLEYFRKYQLEKYSEKRLNRSSIGWKGERFVQKLLGADRWPSRKYDLLWNDESLEVKTARPHFITVKVNGKAYRTRIWAFLVKRQTHTVKWFAFLSLDEDGKTILSLYVVPAHLIRNNVYVRLGRNSQKFSKYKVEVGGEL